MQKNQKRNLVDGLIIALFRKKTLILLFSTAFKPDIHLKVKKKYNSILVEAIQTGPLGLFQYIPKKTLELNPNTKIV
ncbi:hypothetical protein GCM10009119_23700 [Algoriphagus jejuensis]|uniref:Uncharacterized protein n=1 Tax=Algoriphagus jejuensis TaxID=419934 RepID=A0ABN1N0U6_9BACT